MSGALGPRPPGRVHPKGLTAERPDTLAASATGFLARLGTQQDAETARGRAADVRIGAANALYTELIDLCAVGKALFAQTDARKYQDYVVSDTPAPGGPVVPPKV